MRSTVPDVTGRPMIESGIAASGTESLHVASGDLWAGAEVQVAALLPALNDLGAVARAVILNEGELAAALRERGVETIVLQESDGAIRTVVGLRRLLRETRPTVVHSHGYKEAILSHLASLGLDVERVRTIHGVPELRVGGSRTRMSAYRVAERMLSWSLGVHAIAVSRELERIESRICAWRSGVSYVANAVPDRSARPSPARSELWPPRTGPLLLYVGRLEPIKGPDVLLDAFTRIHAEEPDASLWFAGDGSLRPRLEQRIEELALGGAVHLLGESHCIPELMDACDLLVLPSRGEGMPTVLLEALAASVPVVATRVGAIPEVTQDGAFASLVPPEDPAALSDACLRLLRDPPRRRELASRGAGVILREFSPESSARQTLAIYSRLSAGRKGLRATSR